MRNTVQLFLLTGLLFYTLPAQTTMAVIDFDARGISNDEVATLTDRFRDELTKTNQYIVIERGKMEEVLKEQGIQQSGCTSDECVVEVGNLIGVQQMVGGSIGKVGNVYSVSARIIDVQTGEILNVTTYDYSGSIGGLLTTGMQQIVSQLILERTGRTVTRQEELGSLYITSEPGGATVWVDGIQQTGTTPVMLDNQAVGEHEVLVKKDDYSAGQLVSVIKDDVTKLNLILQLDTGKLKVVSMPFEATVIVDGKEKGLTPVVISKLRAGTHEIIVQLAGYHSYQQSILIKSNAIEELKVNLKKKWKPGNLQAQVLNDSQIKLTWEQEEKRINGFRIERQVNGGSWIQVAEIAADVTQFTDTELNTISNYYLYRVQAYTAGNVSEYSNFAGVGNILIDIDGNVYQTIRIGNQIWLAENLKVTHYRDGTVIPHLTSDRDWTSTNSGAYCYYGNISSNGDTYGALYNWYAVTDSRNIAPEGWHVPTDDDWKELEMHLSMSQSEADSSGWRGANEGSKLAGNADLWNDGKLVNNSEFGSSGFTALPGGYRSFYIGYNNLILQLKSLLHLGSYRNYYNGNFNDMGNYGYFWSSTEYYSYNAWNRVLNYDFSDVYRYYYNEQDGFSVRLVRDD